MPESEAKKMFRQHLTDLGASSNPAIEIIKPRSGKSPILKITFMTGGKRGNSILWTKPLQINMSLKLLHHSLSRLTKGKWKRLSLTELLTGLIKLGTWYMIRTWDFLAILNIDLNSTWPSESLSMACLAFPGQANHIHLWLNWTILNLRITSRKVCLQFKSPKGEILKEGDPLLLRIVLQKIKEKVREITKEEVLTPLNVAWTLVPSLATKLCGLGTALEPPPPF